MKKLEFSIVILIVWLILLFNIERLTKTVDIRSYTYIFVAFVAAVTVMFPKLSRGAFSLMLVVIVPVYLILKPVFEAGTWEKNLFEGYAFPITVTQVGAIVLTGIFARQISLKLVEFNQIIADITFGRIGTPPPRFSDEQGIMYNEMNRARRFQRPLTILAFKVGAKTVQKALPKMMEEVQQTMMKEYVYAWIARILDENLLRYDAIAQRDDYFIVLLPETTTENVPDIAQRIVGAVETKVDVRLNVGVANFPNDAVTFESLIDLALQNSDKHSDLRNEF